MQNFNSSPSVKSVMLYGGVERGDSAVGEVPNSASVIFGHKAIIASLSAFFSKVSLLEAVNEARNIDMHGLPRQNDVNGRSVHSGEWEHWPPAPFSNTRSLSCQSQPHKRAHLRLSL